MSHGIGQALMCGESRRSKSDEVNFPSRPRVSRRLVTAGQLDRARIQDNQILISAYDEILTRGVLSQLLK